MDAKTLRKCYKAIARTVVFWAELEKVQVPVIVDYCAKLKDGEGLPRGAVRHIEQQREKLLAKSIAVVRVMPAPVRKVDVEFTFAFGNVGRLRHNETAR